jgi:hypothetical protein
MKCTFISPHRSDVGRAKPASDKHDRIRSDSGGKLNKRGWMTSLCLITAILFLGLNSLTAGHCNGIGNNSQWKNPVHHELILIKEADYKMASLNEVDKWHRIVDSQVPITLKIERFSFDLSYAPEVKSSRMATWSTDGGHPNTAEIYFKPETTNTDHQFGQLMNYNESIQMDMFLFRNEPNITNSTLLNKRLAGCINKLGSNVQIKYLTPLNNLLWLV